MSIRNAKQLKSILATGVVINEAIEYTPAAGVYFTLYVSVLSGDTPVYQDITMTVLKIVEDQIIDALATNVVLLDVASQTNGNKAFFNSTDLLPPAICADYRILISAPIAPDDLTIRIVSMEA